MCRIKVYKEKDEEKMKKKYIKRNDVSWLLYIYKTPQHLSYLFFFFSPRLLSIRVIHQVASSFTLDR